MHAVDPSRTVRLAVVALTAALLVAGCARPAASPSVSERPLSSPTPTASVSARPSLDRTPSPTLPLPSASATATASTTPAPTAAPTDAFVVYTVAPGDSLSLIAGRHGTTWQSLVYWNRDRYPTLNPDLPGYDPNRLTIGWQLVVWPGVVVDYRPPLPTPSLPPATPPPSARPPSALPAPTPVASSTLVSAGSRASTMIALTFDMGGRTDPALAIMTWLRDHDVPATIFLTGASVDGSDAARQVAAMLNARPDLFDLGNHSYGHPDMTTLSATQVADELRRAEGAIGAYATQSPRPLFRPPYGAWDADVLAGAGSAGYRWTVMWDIDTIDWKPIADGGPTAAQIADKVLSRAQGGSIVLMHLGGYETLAALPAIVDGLRDRGFSLVTLNTLLGP